MSSATFATETLGILGAMNNVRLSQTTVFGTFDHGCYGALERVNEHNANGNVRQIFWHIRSQRCIVATGATERPIALATMIARNYACRGGRDLYKPVRRCPSKRVAISPIMMMAGRAPQFACGRVEITAIIDSRPDCQKTPQPVCRSCVAVMLSTVQDALG